MIGSHPSRRTSRRCPSLAAVRSLAACMQSTHILRAQFAGPDHPACSSQVCPAVVVSRRRLMKRTDQGIRRLPPGAAASLSAGHSIHSFADAVVQCCENSLDSRASSVTVAVNLADLSAQISDDGQGIPSASFPLLGQHNCGSKRRCSTDQPHSSAGDTDGVSPSSHDHV